MEGRGVISGGGGVGGAVRGCGVFGGCVTHAASLTTNIPAWPHIIGFGVSQAARGFLSFLSSFIRLFSPILKCCQQGYWGACLTHLAPAPILFV